MAILMKVVVLMCAVILCSFAAGENVINAQSGKVVKINSNEQNELTALMRGLTRNRRSAAQTTCGTSKYPDAGNMPLLKPKIVNGQVARPHEFPWQVLLDVDGGQCGGSIIHPNWVITAAHCFNLTKTIDSMQITITVGEHQTDVSSTVRQEFKAKRLFISDYNDTTNQNDFTLIELDGTIAFNENVTAICLPDAGYRFVFEKAVASGWGHLQSGGEVSELLRYVTLNTTTNDICDSIFNSKPDSDIRIYDNMLCARDNHDDYSRDTCQGDSGGPLAVKATDGKFYLAGVTSFGIGCAGGTPGVYARVTSFLGEIERNAGILPPEGRTTERPMEVTTAANNSDTSVSKEATTAGNSATSVIPCNSYMCAAMLSYFVFLFTALNKSAADSRM